MVKVAKKAKKKKSKLSRKELKQEDKFIATTTKGAQKLGEYRVQILVTILGLLVLIGGIYFFQTQRSARAAAVTKGLGDIQKLLNAKIDKKQKSTDDEPVFKSQADKDKAILKKLNTLLNKYRGAHGAIFMQLYLANTYLRLKQYKKAVQHYQEFLNGISLKDPLRYLGVEGLMMAQRALKQPKVGLKQLERYKENGAPHIKPFALMRLAEYYQAQKDYKKARLYYKQLTQLKTTSAGFKAIAERRLAVLP